MATVPEKNAPAKAEDRKITDVAEGDLRKRGAELKMSNRDAGSSAEAAQNQVPQEGALVTNPPQPEPPHYSEEAYERMDKSNDLSRTVEYPKDRRLGHGVSGE